MKVRTIHEPTPAKGYLQTPTKWKPEDLIMNRKQRRAIKSHRRRKA